MSATISFFDAGLLLDNVEKWVKRTSLSGVIEVGMFDPDAKQKVAQAQETAVGAIDRLAQVLQASSKLKVLLDEARISSGLSALICEKGAAETWLKHANKLKSDVEQVRHGEQGRHFDDISEAQSARISFSTLNSDQKRDLYLKIEKGTAALQSIKDRIEEVEGDLTIEMDDLAHEVLMDVSLQVKQGMEAVVFEIGS